MIVEAVAFVLRRIERPTISRDGDESYRATLEQRLELVGQVVAVHRRRGKVQDCQMGSKIEADSIADGPSSATLVTCPIIAAPASCNLR